MPDAPPPNVPRTDRTDAPEPAPARVGEDVDFDFGPDSRQVPPASHASRSAPAPAQTTVRRPRRDARVVVLAADEPLDEQTALVAQAYRAGASIETIQEHWNLSRRAVLAMLRSTGAIPGFLPEARPPGETTEERDAAIVSAIIDGATLRATGLRFGLSAERVRQIFDSVGGPEAVARRVANIERARLDRKSQREQRIRDALAQNPDATISQVAALTDTWTNEVRALLTPLELAKRADPSRAPHPDRDKILTDLRAVANRYPGRPLTRGLYDRSRGKGSVGSVRITQVFDTWSAALEAAGIEGQAAKRTDYSRRWRDEDLYAAVVRFLRDQDSVGGPISVAAYDRWVAGNPGEPSSMTIRNRLGRWSLVRTEAIRRQATGG